MHRLCSYRIETLSDDGRSLAGSIVLAINLLLGLGQKTLLLGLSALRAVLVQQLEHLEGAKGANHELCYDHRITEYASERS